MTSKFAWAGLSLLATALYILVVGYFSVRIEAASLGLALDWTNEPAALTTPGPAVLPSVLIAVASTLLVALHLVNFADRSLLPRIVVTSGVSLLLLMGFIVGSWTTAGSTQTMVNPANLDGEGDQTSPAVDLLQAAGLSTALLATAGVSAAVFALGLLQARRTQPYPTR